jgi:hypothetical protein
MSHSCASLGRALMSAKRESPLMHTLIISSHMYTELCVEESAAATRTRTVGLVSPKLLLLV